MALVNNTIANIFRTLLSESGLPSSHWIHLIEIVEMIINHTTVESLGWMAPIQAFLGIFGLAAHYAFRLLLQPHDKGMKTG
jgi:hypothetical protein